MTLIEPVTEIVAPAAETPAAETPAAETPAAETPAAETPAAETSAAETPAAESPVRACRRFVAAAAELAAAAAEIARVEVLEGAGAQLRDAAAIASVETASDLLDVVAALPAGTWTPVEASPLQARLLILAANAGHLARRHMGAAPRDDAP